MRTNTQAIYLGLAIGSNVTLPLFLSPISAGWPSPAEDYIDKTINLTEILIHNPAATYLLRAVGDSMIGAGIHDGDILVVDRSLQAEPGKIVIAALDGDLLVKRLVRKNERLYLWPENRQYRPIDVTAHESFLIWGVVNHVIHSF